MKPLWIALGVVALLCCGGVLFFGGAAFFAGKGKLDAAGAYGDESLKAIASQWSASELKSRMAKEVFEQNPEGTIDNVTRVLGQALGPIKPTTLKSRILGIEAKTDTATGTFVTANYEADAEFEKAKGHVAMELIERDGQWKVLKFNGEEVK